MIKAKDFWKFLCEEMDYRIFSGVPCLDFKPLYNTMSTKFMHYIPAVDEGSAFGIALGTSTAGAKSGVLMDRDYIDSVEDWMRYCFDHKVHIVILTNDDIKRKISKHIFDGDYNKLKSFLLKKERSDKPAIIVLKGVK